MSELNDLISGLNNLSKNASKSNADNGLDLDFSFDGASPQDSSLPEVDIPIAETLAGIPLINISERENPAKRPEPVMPNDDEMGGTMFGMPVPKFDKNMTDSQAGTPSPLAGAGLPSPKINAGLPSPKSGAGLPSPKINAGLPSPKINTGLPSPKINAGLPSPKINAGLPSPKAAVIPAMNAAAEPNVSNQVPSKDDDFLPDFNFNFGESDFSGQNPQETAMDWQDAMGGDIPCEPLNLFDEIDTNAIDPQPAQRNFEDSAMGIVKANDSLQAPLLKLDREQPTGAFNQGHDLDNDSGLPLLDDPLNLIGKSAETSDPLGLMNNPPEPAADPLGLIGNTPEPAADPLGLIGNAQEPAADPLGLIGGFEPVAAPETATSMPKSSTRAAATVAQPTDVLNLFGSAESSDNAQAATPEDNRIQTPAPEQTDAQNESAQTDTSANNQPQPSTAYAQSSLKGSGDVEEIGDSDEAGESELVFDLKSIKSGSSAARKVESNGPERNKAMSPAKRKTLIATAITVVVLALVAAAFWNFVYQESQIAEEELPVLPEPEKIDLDWELVKRDSQSAYTTFYKKAREKLQNNEISAQERSDVQGKVLVAVTLAHTRFDKVFNEDELNILDASVAKIAEQCDSRWCALGLWSWGLLRGTEAHKIKFESKIAKEDKTIKEVVALAVDYANWNPEEEDYSTMIAHGEKLLKSVSDEALTWPLTAWIVASTHRRLGQFKEAIQILETMHSDDDTKFSSGALLLEAEIHVATDHINEAIKLAETVLNHKYSDQEDRIRAEQIVLLAKSTTLSDKEFETSFAEYINKNLNNPENIQNAVQICLYANKSEICKKAIGIIHDKNPQNEEVLDAYIRIMLDNLGYVMLVRPDSGCPKVILRAADELVEKGIALAPKNPTFWRHRALVSYALKDYENAENALLEVERGKDIIWQGAFLRELIRFQKADNATKDSIRQKLNKYAKDVFEAEDAVSLAIALDYVGERNSAATLIARAAELHPEQTPILKSYFDLAIATKDKASADKVVKQLEARNALSFEYEFQYAKLLEETGEPNTALEKMLVLIEKTKDTQESMYVSYVGELFFKQNSCDLAMPYFSRALEISGGNDAVAHYYKGRCLYAEKKFSESYTEFSEAGNQDNGNPHYKLWAGLSNIGMNRNADAMKEFTNIIDDFQIKLEKDSLDFSELSDTNKAILADAHFYRAEVRKLHNAKTDALLDYKQALEFWPDELRYLKGYAIFLYENEQLKETIAIIDKAETLSEGQLDAVLYYVRGLCKLRLDNRKDALVELEKALEYGFADLPDSGIIGVRETAEIYERLGYLYRDLGRKDDAKKTLKIFLEKTQVLSNSARKDVQADIDKI